MSFKSVNGEPAHLKSPTAMGRPTSRNKFVTINEIEHFGFDDCVINKFDVSPAGISLLLDALIIKRDNSQNANYTDSYADVTTARFEEGRIISGIKDGFRYYDADDNFISEEPDVELSAEELKAFPKKSEGAYLYDIEKNGEENGEFFYTLCVEFVDEEDSTMAESYQIRIAFAKAVFEWEKYMNRVQ